MTPLARWFCFDRPNIVSPGTTAEACSHLFTPNSLHIELLMWKIRLKKLLSVLFWSKRKSCFIKIIVLKTYYSGLWSIRWDADVGFQLGFKLFCVSFSSLHIVFSFSLYLFDRTIIIVWVQMHFFYTKTNEDNQPACCQNIVQIF